MLTCPKIRYHTGQVRINTSYVYSIFNALHALQEHLCWPIHYIHACCCHPYTILNLALNVLIIYYARLRRTTRFYPQSFLADIESLSSIISGDDVIAITSSSSKSCSLASTSSSLSLDAVIEPGDAPSEPALRRRGDECMATMAGSDVTDMSSSDTWALAGADAGDRSMRETSSARSVNLASTAVTAATGHLDFSPSSVNSSWIRPDRDHSANSSRA